MRSLDSGFQSLLEVVAEAVDDRVGLGLGEDLVDDGLDAARSPLAALAEVGFGALAEDVGRRGGGRGLGQSEGAVAERGEGGGQPAAQDGQSGQGRLDSAGQSRPATPTAPIAPRASIMSRTRLIAVRRVRGMP